MVNLRPGKLASNWACKNSAVRLDKPTSEVSNCNSMVSLPRAALALAQSAWAASKLYSNIGPAAVW